MGPGGIRPASRQSTPALNRQYASLKSNITLANSHDPVRPDLRRTLYQIKVSLSAVLDLGPLLSAMAEMGIDHAHLHADDMRISQGIGRLATWLGCDGLLAPSARAVGTNLVIYPGLGWGVLPV